MIKASSGAADSDIPPCCRQHARAPSMGTNHEWRAPVRGPPTAGTFGSAQRVLEPLVRCPRNGALLSNVSMMEKLAGIITGNTFAEVQRPPPHALPRAPPWARLRAPPQAPSPAALVMLCVQLLDSAMK